MTVIFKEFAPKIVSKLPTIFDNQYIKTSYKKLLACGYARVSTKADEQEKSYDAQLEYFEQKIKKNPEWKFAGLYSDKGITGTSLKRRDGFNQMISDAMAGKIDVILIKSVKRFARNTVDAISVIRKLMDKGIGIIFETENINTLEMRDEVVVTIHASLAQEESHTISESVKWGKRKRMAEGKVNFSGKVFGYKKIVLPNKESTVIIVEEEAQIVRLIFDKFIEGKNYSEIADLLNIQGFASPKIDEKWRYNGVQRILQNEKYTGNAILQKTYTKNYLTHESVKNDGFKIPIYMVEKVIKQ